MKVLSFGQRPAILEFVQRMGDDLREVYIECGFFVLRQKRKNGLGFMMKNQKS